jgi:TonB family protein
MAKDSDISKPDRKPLQKTAFLCRAGLGVMLSIGMLIGSVAQAEDMRKARSNPPPEYPELAKRLKIRGAARVRVTIAPDGEVKAVQEVGGNPVLVDALVRAVRKWTYEPADKISVLEVKFDFGE